MSRTSVTVFTKRDGNGFSASTIRTDACGQTEEIAARRAAADFFNQPLHRIRVSRENANVFVAYLDVELTGPGKPIEWADVLLFAFLLGATAALLFGVAR